jgi:hypothetical protein
MLPDSYLPSRQKREPPPQINKSPEVVLILFVSASSSR